MPELARQLSATAQTDHPHHHTQRHNHSPSWHSPHITRGHSSPRTHHTANQPHRPHPHNVQNSFFSDRPHSAVTRGRVGVRGRLYDAGSGDTGQQRRSDQLSSATGGYLYQRMQARKAEQEAEADRQAKVRILTHATCYQRSRVYALNGQEQ